MIVHIIRDRGFVAALGHRVALHLGGEPELKRRVLASLSQLDDPPDEVTFLRFESQPRPAAAAANDQPPPAEPEPEPEPRPKPPPRRGQKGK